MTYLLRNNEPGTKTDDPRITISSSTPNVMRRKENYATGNPTANNLAPQTAATGSAFVSAIHPQYPSEAPCGQPRVNITVNSRLPALWSSKRVTAFLPVPIKSANGTSKDDSSAKATVTEASTLEKADGIRSSGASKGKIVSNH